MPALAQAASSGSGSYGSLLFLLLPIALLVFMFMASRKRQRQMQSAQAAISVGDEVSTTSGLLGRLVAMDDQIGTLEVAPGVQLRFDRRAIVPRTMTDATRSDAAAPESGNTDEPKA